MEPAIFLDRDNTLIANDGDLGDPAEVRLLDGVQDGLRALRDAGYRLVVVTNQAGVARGRISEQDVDAVHQRIASLINGAPDGGSLIDRFYYCPYHPEGTAAEYKRDHPWRKPHPGMLLQAARDMELDLTRSWMIGDQDRDVHAGRSAGCRTVLLAGDPATHTDAGPTATASDFDEAVQIILAQTPSRAEMWDEPAGASAAPVAPISSGVGEPADVTALRRSILELAEEVRSDRLRRTEFTPLKLAAGLCQLLVLLMGLLGLLQLGSFDAFVRWMIGAVLLQLLTIAMLLVDQNR